MRQANRNKWRILETIIHEACCVHSVWPIVGRRKISVDDFTWFNDTFPYKPP